MKIPKTIHKGLFIDNGKIPDIPIDFKNAIDTWSEKNDNYRVVIYSLDDAVTYIKKNYDEIILNYFLKLKPHAFKADFFTLLVLYNEGGWVTGSRAVCYEPLEILNNQNKEFYVCVDAHINPNCLWNGFTGSIPGHPIIKKYIDMIKFNIDNEHYGIDCLYITGPGVYMQAAVDYLRKHSDKCLIGKHILDNQKQSFIFFGNIKIAKHKYINIKPGVFSDIPGGNNYGEMWKNWDIYN